MSPTSRVFTNNTFSKPKTDKSNKQRSDDSDAKMPRQSVAKGEKQLLEAITKDILMGRIEEVKKAARHVKNKDRQYWTYGKHKSPVHIAAGYGHPHILTHLLDEAGFRADCYLSVGDTQRISALQWAIHHQRKACVAILLERGADLWDEGYWWDVGGNAMAFAERKKNKPILKMIQDEAERRTKDGFRKVDSASSSVSGSGPCQDSSSAAEVAAVAIVANVADSNVDGPGANTSHDAEGAAAVPAPSAEPHQAHQSILDDGTSASMVSTESSATSTASSSGSGSLVKEISGVIKVKMKEKRRELRRAEELDAKIRSLEAEIFKLKSSEDYRSHVAKERIEVELSDLEGKYSRVKKVLKKDDEDGDDEEDGEEDAIQCCVCLSAPPAAVWDCRRCDAVMCAACLDARTDCQVCGVDFGACVPRRNRWAERLAARRQRHQ